MIQQKITGSFLLLRLIIKLEKFILLPNLREVLWDTYSQLKDELRLTII